MHTQASKLTLGSLFTDHMVVQRGRRERLWGWDRPGQSVTVRVEQRGGEGEELVALADHAGNFTLELPELAVGGPYRITVSGSTTQVLKDVLCGEVWLASGQSNMEWKVASSDGATREIAEANWPELRMFKVANTVASEPAERTSGEWRVCSPEWAGDFSAVGYFFARELQRRLGVPVGVIDASWGGTPIEAWLSLEALRAVPSGATELERLREHEAEAPALRAQQLERVLAWERERLPADPGNAGFERGWARPDFDDSSWPSMPLPGVWQAHGLLHNGVVWFRRTLELPAAWAGRELVLSLGAIDDFDATYFEGVAVGAHPKGTPSAYQIRRRYTVPAALVHAGRVQIAVRVFDHVGEGGLLGPSGEMSLSPRDEPGAELPLSGAWRYQVEHAIPLVPMEVFQSYPAPLWPEPQHLPAALYNAMIAPLLGYSLRGALWYQGESNAGAHTLYRERLVALIRDWRARFGFGQFPFFVVQLANFNADPGWAFLREAQAQACAEPLTGLAVTIDIGDPNDIHPRNKQDVGRRLARLALARSYGIAGVDDEGPTLERVEIAGSTARVHFRSARGLRARDAGAPRGFELAGADRAYHAADARIDGENVLLSSSLVPQPITVRYAWAAQPDANLENAAGLPAAPFRTDGYACESP